jgi:delta 1-pyrroline-5-carboxylate dehydrogenase
MFKQALQMKLRFVSQKHSSLSVEDLFDYPLTQLKAMANHYNAQLKAPDDLFAVRSTQETKDKLRLDILLTVIADRNEEALAKADAKVQQETNSQIKQLIIQKKNEELSGKSVEELEAMLK